MHIAHSQVAASRKADPKSAKGKAHLPASSMSYKQTFESVCPTDPFWHECPCVESGDAAKMIPKNGPQLILVPAGLIDDWIKEFEICFGDGNNVLDMHLVVAHRATKGPLNIDRSTFKSNLRTKGYGRDSSGTTYEGQENLVCLSTVPSFLNKLQDSTALQFKDSWKSAPKKRRDDLSVAHSIFCPAWLIQDEFHMNKGIDAGACTMIKGFNRMFPDARPWKIFMSGTPVEISPADLAGPVSTMESEEWKDKDHPYHSCRHLYLKDLAKTFASYVKTGIAPTDTKIESICKKFSSILPKLMLRRSENAKWFGHEVLDLPPLRQLEKSVPFPQEYQQVMRQQHAIFQARMTADLDAAIEAWKQAGSNGSQPTASSEKAYLNNSRRMRMIAGIPYLAKYFTENPNIRLTNEEVLRNDWLGQKSPLYQQIPLIYKHAPKLHFLQKIMNEKLGTDEKLVVVTNWTATADLITSVSAS